MNAVSVLLNNPVPLVIIAVIIAVIIVTQWRFALQVVCAGVLVLQP